MSTSTTQTQALVLLRNATDPAKLEVAVLNIAQGKPRAVWRRELVSALLEALHMVGTTPHHSEIINHLEKETQK